MWMLWVFFSIWLLVSKVCRLVVICCILGCGLSVMILVLNVVSWLCRVLKFIVLIMLVYCVRCCVLFRVR